VELGLMCRQGNVFAQLAQEFAIGTVEALRVATGGDHHAENVALHDQGRNHKRAKSSVCESPLEFEFRSVHVGVVNQLAAHAL
jgi:hypothetical protein